MATILMTWELGSGLGHLYPLRALGTEFVARGHRVVAALRETWSAARIYEGTGIQFLPAPAKHRTTQPRFDSPVTYAHLLHNVGLGDRDELAGLLGSWDTIFDLVRPDLVVLDHSPTALLALRGRSCPRAIVGTGFYVPPDTQPLVTVRSWAALKATDALKQEQLILATVNGLLENRGQCPLQRFAKLFHEVDEMMLTTFPELDHFGPRQDVSYWGSFASGSGVPPIWPAGKGPKVFAYLKPFSAAKSYLEVLGQLGWPTLIVAEGLGELRNQLTFPNIHWSAGPVDIGQAATQCDVAITHAGHGATASLLLNGAPLVQLPIYIEQFLVADRVKQMGAGTIATLNNVNEFTSTLQAVVSQGSHREAARRFASRYAAYNAVATPGKIAARLEQLIRG